MTVNNNPAYSSDEIDVDVIASTVVKGQKKGICKIADAQTKTIIP